ncbi:hypothetical protein A8950_3666 [Dongia mobilis]|uniref:Uncharacterized protein n=1 Tax=Dongia mobilis TaxID=578943 RepID=A0A4R6WJB1_9PROT|nr:hypothetical protein [Dongia mobilis]TDQ78610.1 hypothetical protein A8950_3666 [Dongia mobilis]
MTSERALLPFHLLPFRLLPFWRRAWPWALLLAACLAVAFWLRYGLIQSTPIGLSCLDAATAPWYCGPREVLVRFNMWAGWSFAALGFGVLALLTRHRLAIALGLAAGALGLVLYNAGPAAGGLIMALFALLRR